jgi:hypothetical protein
MASKSMSINAYFEIKEESVLFVDAIRDFLPPRSIATTSALTTTTEQGKSEAYSVRIATR